MPKIIKTTTGEASFVLEQHFEDEAKAQQGVEPTNETVKGIEIKIENIKWRRDSDRNTI